MPAQQLSLPPLAVQAERLIELGAHGPLSAAELRRVAAGEDRDGALLVTHPDHAPASALALLLRRGAKAGFIVQDMTDVDDFVPIDGVQLPFDSAYIIEGLDRGDTMLNWSPDEAFPAIGEAGRTPLTLGEGIHWLLQLPAMLERGRCFMTIGSRLRKPDGSLDARTPALWISNGTGRDGPQHRNAPKVGWCWAGNRHTWLGFASASTRRPALPSAP